ncbi:ABC transporter permease [Amycolatopsis pithecellobii]|uniref:ABC transporter permease subunit n=1 Tax=Amycolatopsis pithecellobii TaxID=664692 RepID=A0A6N7Z7C5_9PSEU|nr:ABC transporter permease [Amycolatopsis pithecellobii]MTD56950.1 ABC transporter permease subunit [Amycolatopsis pithecellobii]
MRTIALVAKRELDARLRRRSFVIGTIVILVVLCGYLLFQHNLVGDANKVRIGLTGQTAGIAQELQAGTARIGKETQIAVVSDPEEGMADVQNDRLDVLLSGNAANLDVLVKSDVDPQVRALLNGISQQQVLNAKLLEAGLDPAQVMSEVDSAQITVSTIDTPDPERTQRLAIGLITVFLLFFAIQTYGGLVAQGVVEEKAGRVVEMVLSTVRPWQLILGKVLGLGLTGLVQIGILAVAGLAVASSTGIHLLSSVATGTVWWGLLWYVLGFFLYAMVYAAAGSLVSRQEDAASVITPVTMVLTIGFVAGFTVLLRNPAGDAARTLSLIPLFSPILMPGRMAIGTATGWETALSLVLTLALGALLTWVGSRIYRNAVLHMGSRLKLADALRG